MRNEKGQFVKGVSGNPKGRKPKDRELRYYAIALESVPYTQWEKIVRKAAYQAEKGDAVARKSLADYLMGAPVQKVENRNVEMTGSEFIQQYTDDEGGEDAPD